MNRKDVSIVLCGPAGQGIQTAEKLLISIFRKAGYFVFTTKEYMSRIRGGSNSIAIRIASEPVCAPVDRMDIAIPFDKDALDHIRHKISPQTVIFGERETLLPPNSDDRQIVNLPLSELAREAGGKLFVNVIVTGLLASLFRIENAFVSECIREIFGNKGKEIIEKNLNAIEQGYQFRKEIVSASDIQFDLKKPGTSAKQLLINGAEAVSLGAVAGRCRFIASYPMSPSTAVLTFLAKHGRQFDVLAEQAEDEIAAINMALGASYAGARSMVTTSGGGFALMTEGVSLAGMIETPVVIHIAQRPGPATGLPTRTEQGDLLFALHAGHGEFPRVILAPGTLEDGFFLSQRAFEIADKYQIPVFLLTDQYFMDTYCCVQPFDLSLCEHHDTVIKTDKHYQRYAFSETGISLRGIPGYGDGLVMADSDEHDPSGHITEDHELRTQMVDKRLKKFDALAEEALPPDQYGPGESETVVLCWGSTVQIVREAVQTIQKDIAVLYFKQVFPISSKTIDLFKEAKTIISVENNATAQFTGLLQSQMKTDSLIQVLKYNGLPFSVEELRMRILKAIA